MALIGRCPQDGPNLELRHEATRLRTNILDGEKRLQNIQNLIKEAERNPSKILQLTKQVEKLSSQLKRKTRINDDLQDRLIVYEEKANDRERMLDLPQRSNYGESNELVERSFNLVNVHNPENNHNYAEGFKLKKRPKLTGECLHRDVVENLNEAYLTKISPQEAENSLPELAQTATSTLYEKEQKQTTIHSNIVECAACKYNTNTESASLKNKLALRNLESIVTNQEKEIQRLLQNQTETEKQLSEFRTKYAEKLKLVSKLQNENATHAEKIVNLETSIDNQLGAQNQQTEENSQLQKDLRTTKQR